MKNDLLSQFYIGNVYLCRISIFDNKHQKNVFRKMLKQNKGLQHFLLKKILGERERSILMQVVCYIPEDMVNLVTCT